MKRLLGFIIRKILFVSVVLFSSFIAIGQTEGEDPECNCFKCYAATMLDLEDQYVKEAQQIGLPVIAVSSEGVSSAHLYILFCDNGKINLHNGTELIGEYNFIDFSSIYSEPEGTRLTIYDFIDDIDYTLKVQNNLLSNDPSEVIVAIYPESYDGGTPKLNEKYFYWFCRIME